MLTHTERERLAYITNQPTQDIARLTDAEAALDDAATEIEAAIEALTDLPAIEALTNLLDDVPAPIYARLMKLIDRLNELEQ